MEVGLDRLGRATRLIKRLATMKVGVLAHAASVDRHLRHLGDVLAGLKISPALFFGPEHGYGGEAQDMIGVESAVDIRTGAPIVSLYGTEFSDLTPKAEHLAQIDVLLIDLADVGARYYTFVWTALMAMRAARDAGVVTVVLDRPNPISGARSSVEGATQTPGFLSFVGLEAIPIRHGLTVGEIVALYASREGMALGTDGGFAAIGVEGWDRERRADGWDRPFVQPSPNMPTLETAVVYPGGCLIEGTNLSEGRGTTKPFELVGAPWLDGRALAGELAATGLPGFVARPVTFLPMFQKHAKKICGGVEIHVTDADAFRPVATYVALIALARQLDPENFKFRTERYEYVDTIPAIDLLLGSSDAREAMIAGGDAREIAELAGKADPEFGAVMSEARAALQLADVMSGI
jgi:uncharacterized protein YbbC (DUF1343 family)